MKNLKRAAVLGLVVIMFCTSIPQTVYAEENISEIVTEAAEEATEDVTDEPEVEEPTEEEPDEPEIEEPTEEEPGEPAAEEPTEDVTDEPETEEPAEDVTDKPEKEEPEKEEPAETVTKEPPLETVTDLTPEVVMEETETEEEPTYELDSDVWVNPLYEDVVTEEELIQPDLTSVTVTDGEERALVEYADTIEKAGQILREGMEARKAEIAVGYQYEGSFDVSIARKEIFPEAVKHTGKATEGDYLRWQYAGCQVTASYKEQDGICYVEWVFTITWYTTSDQEQEMNKAVSDCLNQLSLDGLTDYEKISKIYDYICRNVVYDFKNYSNNDYKLKYTAYAALLNHSAVCQGYALLFYRLALEENIDTRLIAGTGNGEAHGWNIVRLGDKYYNLDTTWDASGVQAGSGKKYFLKSTADFTDHVREKEYDTAEFNNQYPMAKDSYEQGVDAPRAVSDSSMKSGQKVTYDLVEYGTYPQKEITKDESVYQQLCSTSGWDDNSDIVILGQKYHRENGRYYICDAITWRVLELDDSGNAVLQANQILDNRAYADSNSSSWYDSGLRKWLNGIFLSQAFSESEQSELKTAGRKLVYVGDSYLDGYSPDGNVTAWGKLTDQLLGISGSASYHTGGYGFALKGGYGNLLTSTGDDTVTDVIILGGWNDKYNVTGIQQGAKSTITKCRKLYPNAQIHIGMVAFDTDQSRFDRDAILEEYVRAAVTNGCSYIGGIEDALDKSGMASDGIHPNAKGQEKIAKALAAYLSDKVILPAASQLYGTKAATRTAYVSASDVMDEARRRTVTDYAKAKGAAGDWWLKTPGTDSELFVYDLGDICRVGYAATSSLGVCPVIRLNLNSCTEWNYEGTYSTDAAKDARDTQGFSRENGLINGQYYRDGLPDNSMTGIVEVGNIKYYVENGKVKSNFNGIITAKDGKKYYVRNGVLDTGYTGIAKDKDQKQYYVKNGVVQNGYTGLVQETGSAWYYVVNGQVNTSYNGPVKHSDGKYYYVKSGMIDWSANGLIYDGKTWYYVKSGVWQSGYNGFVQHVDTRWYYVENGKINFSFTGLALHTDGQWYYAEKGIINWGYNGVAKNAYNHWYWVKSGKYDSSANGLCYLNGTWYDINHGEWKKDYIGFEQHVDKQWYYVKNGKIDFSVTALARHVDGQWFYAEKGIVNWNYTGLAQSTDGAWFAVRDGRYDSSFTGLYEHYGSWYYLKNGYLDWNFSSLVQHTDGVWYYVDHGKLNWNYTGLTNYYDTWYYVENGVLNWNYSGLTYYEGQWYYVENGVLNWNFSSLYYYNGDWYYVLNGHIDWNYTSLVCYYDTWYYVDHGKLNWNYTGLTNYYGTWYYVENGVLNWSYTGLIYYNNIWYYIENGIYNWNYNGLTYYNGGWYYLQNGYINWNFTSLVQHTDGAWYYVDHGQINWGYTGPVQYYNTWYYIQNGKLNWNYNGSGVYEGIAYTVRNGIVYFEEQMSMSLIGCNASDYTGRNLTVTLTANVSGKDYGQKFCIIQMNSAGTTAIAMKDAFISKNGTWKFSATLSSNDSFRDVMMSRYAVGIRTGNGYQIISDTRMLENPEITATMTKNYNGYYTSKKISSKKGIQGVSDGYTEDIGVQHVLLNIDLADMISTSARSGYVPFSYKGKTYYFQDMIALEQTIRYLNGWDNDNPYGWHSRSVTVVLLMSWKDELSYLIHPSARRKGAANYYALNMKDDNARETFEALFCYMGEKLGDHKSLVSNWTLGNEVNSCNVWNYSGNMSLNDNVANYAEAFRLLYQGVKRTASNSRVFISLDHCWNKAEAGFSGKAYLDAFASYMNANAPTLQWNINYHPYSQPLTRNAFWSDNGNTVSNVNTAYISMKNIQVLTDYVGTLESRYGKAQGSVRVIIGELGYSARSGQQEENTQAAALGYGYYIAMFNSRIDAYIVRAYVDDAAEIASGLYLGMFDRSYHQKKSYNVYKHLDTDESLAYMNLYLSTVGISSWSDVIPGFNADALPAVDF